MGVLRIKKHDMKNNNKLFWAVAGLLLFSTVAFGQSKETRDLGDFSSVSVGEAIDLVLIQGNANQAVVNARGIDLSDVLTEISGSRLKVHLDDGRYNNVDVSIVLTSKAIDKLQVSSAANVETEGVLKADDLEVAVSSAGEAELELSVVDLEVDISSSGELSVSGTAQTQDVEVSSAGSYNGADLKCKEADVSVSSAGSAKLNVTGSLNANASSGGSVRYTGDPDKVRENSSSGGNVRSY